MVTEEPLSDSKDDLYPDVGESNQVCHSLVYSAGTGDRCHKGLALSDTCCARTVVGEDWIQGQRRRLHRRGLVTYVVDEHRPFRFGGGPRVMSEYAVLFPLGLPKSTKQVWVKASVVRQQVLLLLSRALLKQMGAVMDLPDKTVRFKNLKVAVDLVETETGLCGFKVDAGFTPDAAGEAPWAEMVGKDLEK